MGKAYMSFQMGIDIGDIIKKARKMAKAYLFGKMEIDMMETLKTTR